jgi:hypothetical protein
MRVHFDIGDSFTAETRQSPFQERKVFPQELGLNGPSSYEGSKLTRLGQVNVGTPAQRPYLLAYRAVTNDVAKDREASYIVDVEEYSPAGRILFYLNVFDSEKLLCTRLTRIVEVPRMRRDSDCVPGGKAPRNPMMSCTGHQVIFKIGR